MTVLDGIGLEIREGEAVGIVGESGSGKTMLALAVAGLLPPGAGVTQGSIAYLGRDLVSVGPKERRGLLGREIGMVFQDPMTALHPAYPVGWQIAEAVRRTGADRKEARRRAVVLLSRVGIPDPERRAKEHPHRFSGGMRQRAALAIALAQSPSLLLADEPTTALDVTIQAEILDLLHSLRAELGLALVLITHDLGVVAGNVARVTVLYAGRVAEEASVEDLFRAPRHPYTLGLLRSLPRGSGERLRGIPGTVPRAGDLPPGCGFAPRCELAEPRCRQERPELLARDGAGRSACHLADRVPPFGGAGG